MNIYMEKSCSECSFNGRLFMQLQNAIFIFLSKELYRICTFLAETKHKEFRMLNGNGTLSS